MSSNCLIWGTPISDSWRDKKNARFQTVVSPRAGGKYVYHNRLTHPGGPLDELDEFGKARLTTWLVSKRKDGEGCPEITSAAIEAAKSGRTMLMKQRLLCILEFLENNEGSITINTGPSNPLLEDSVTTYYELLAHSESRESDLGKLLDYLVEKGLIRKPRQSIPTVFQYFLTVDGAMYLDESRNITPDSDKVFVAMWFDPTLDRAYDEAIAPAIRTAGYEPKRADREEFVDEINDWIIGQIRQARFVVADFSQGPDGARGGVYYEAGFAHGLGRKVVFTCREEDEDDLHFDTDHYNHIFWKSKEDLKKRLKDRIIAVMGDGPRKEESSDH